MKKLTFPCMAVKLVPIKKVVANDYNPNKVATPEMKLLIHSIEEDGLTMPIVTFHDKENDKYIIVDGEHRYMVVKDHFKSDVIPVSVVDKPIEDRMASTVRHNRARGVHQVESQADMVRKLAQLGWGDADIAKHLGMSFEEVLRLKQVVGVASMLKVSEYSKSFIGGEEFGELNADSSNAGED